MLRRLHSIAAAALVAAAFAFGVHSAAGQPAPVSPPYSSLGGVATLTANTGSQATALPSTNPQFRSVTLYNSGTVDAYFALGASTVTATTSPTGVAQGKLKAGTYYTLWAPTVTASGGPAVTHIAVITGSSSTTIELYQANGPIQFGMVGAPNGAAPTGPAGGSLAGTYPNPSLSAPGLFNANAATAPTAITGTALQVVGADATVGRIQVNSFGAIAAVSVTRANGTGASPTPVLSGDQIGGFNAYSYVTSAAPGYVGPVASVQSYATQNHTTTTMGSRIILATIPNGSTTLTTALTVDQDQSVTGAFTMSATAFIPTGSTIPAYGIYSSSSNISFSAGSARQAFIDGNGINSTNSSGYRLTSLASTTTVGTLCPNRADATTCIGGTSGTLSLIVGGAEIARISSSALSLTTKNIDGVATLTAQSGSITASTASSSSTTGALVVTGGLGVGGEVFLGAGLTVANNISAGTVASSRLALTNGSTALGDTLTTASKIYVPLYTNTTALAVGTSANWVNALLGVPTLVNTTNARTFTDAANLYISGAPVAGANVTLTNAWALYVASGNTFLSGIVAGPTEIQSANFRASSTGNYYWNTRSQIGSSADGIIELFNNGKTGFTRLNFGGITNLFPAVRVNGTSLEVVVADNSAFAPLAAASFSSSGNITSSTGSVQGVNVLAANSGFFGFGSTATYWGSPTAGTWRSGLADAATAVAQTLRVQSVVAGTTNTAGANWTLIGSLSTGSGTSGNIIFQVGVAPGAGSPTVQATPTTALTIAGETLTATFSGSVSTVASVFATGNFSALSNTTKLQLGASQDVILNWDAANTLAQRNGVNAQNFRIYNTYTNASNGEWGTINWTDSANVLTIATRANGTGSVRALQIGSGGGAAPTYFQTNGVVRWQIDGSAGHLLAQTDNTIDIGASAATRPRTGYFGTSLVASNSIMDGSSMRVATATAIPAGGDNGIGFKATSTGNYGVFFGSGAPTLSAAKGSLYLRSDGTGTADRAYINTNGSTTWTNLVTGGWLLLFFGVRRRRPANDNAEAAARAA